MQESSQKDRNSFIKNLFEFLKTRKVPNLKIPQIGGKELDLLALYNAVIKRGGAENVSNKKLWKEIVNEFDLPPSCTSASFTLKNHYQKYLLQYEQKVYFGKDDTEIITELGRQRNTRKPYFQVSPVQKFETRRNNGNLEKNIKAGYKDKLQQNQKMNIFYIEKQRMIPTNSEIRRIILAFESKILQEVKFCLNSLLLYSVSKQSPFDINNYRIVYNELIEYFYYVLDKVKNCSIFIENKKQQYNKKDILNDQDVSLNEYILQLKIILTIFRNFFMIKTNEIEISKNEKFKKKLFSILLQNNDSDINKIIYDIFIVLSKFLQLDEEDPIHLQYIQKIINSLNSQNSEEKECAVENLHNLMMNQENETLIENNLQYFVGSLVKLLLVNNLGTLEKVLEIICHFSDLKMATRVVFAREDEFFARLIALIAGNSSKYQKIAKLSAIIIDNITVTPGTRQYLKPYELDLFLIASTEETVSKTLCVVLERLKQINYDNQQQMKKLIENLGKEIENFQVILKKYDFQQLIISIFQFNFNFFLNFIRKHSINKIIQ